MTIEQVWTDERIGELQSLWGRLGKRRIAEKMGLTVGQITGKARVLNLHFDRPGEVRALPASHPALVNARSLFPTQVEQPSGTYRVLKPGVDTTKLGRRVEKGPWTGMPIFSLTLEERATCPRSCLQWGVCYGNSMPFAKRLVHGVELEAALQRELRELQINNYRGFVVRLHILGDFYSVDYVNAWRGWLRRFPALHVFGYTAHPQASEIGAALSLLRADEPTRFVIRFSGSEAVVVKRPEDADGSIVCPAQTGATRSCGTCGLCFTRSFTKTVAFVEHGMKARGNSRGEE
ncbi:MAG TPA: hypothetical protein VG271_13460 [Beijerinckiaceae bacterium]|jgi:hypothetical protein|nr:hypothetical protein [Beijerinckiaceae bacterium]